MTKFTRSADSIFPKKGKLAMKFPRIRFFSAYLSAAFTDYAHDAANVKFPFEHALCWSILFTRDAITCKIFLRCLTLCVCDHVIEPFYIYWENTVNVIIAGPALSSPVERRSSGKNSLFSYNLDGHCECCEAQNIINYTGRIHSLVCRPDSLDRQTPGSKSAMFESGKHMESRENSYPPGVAN